LIRRLKVIVSIVNLISSKFLLYQKIKKMNKFLKLIVREFKLLSKNYVIIAIFIGAPFLYAVLLGSVYSDAKVTNLPIIVVDLDNTPLSNNVIDALDDNQYLEVERILLETNSKLELQLIKDKYHAVVTIPEGFEADINQKRHPEIDADVDAANMLTANYITTGIMSVLGTLNAGIEIATLQKKGIPTSIAEEQYESFKINVNRHFNPSSNYLHFLSPGMLGTVMQQVFLLALALSFAQEFQSNTFSELLKFSTSSTYLIITKAIPYILVGILVWQPLFHFSSVIFHTPLAENQLAYWAITLLFFISLSSMGILASIAFQTELKATEVLMVIATPSFIISGQTWPLSQMPQWVQTLANAIPITHYLEAIRKLIMYKANFTDILPQIEAMTILTVISMSLAIVLLKIKISRVLLKTKNT